MKLIWHIFLKDLRRLAVPLALWVLLLAVKYLLGWRLISWTGTEEQYFQRMVQLGYVVVWFEVIANFLLVSRLVHEDSLVGGNAFWITRPISGGRLLAAKALGFVGLFGVLPLLVAMPWWLANHYDASLMGEAALELVLAQAAISLPALGLAAVTDGLSRLLLWLLVLAATATWWFFNALAGVSNLTSGGGSLEGASLTRTCVALGLITLLIGAVVVLQYFTRRLVRSLIISASGMALVGLVAWLWPWNWVPSWRREYSGGPPIKVSSVPSGISFTMVRAQVPNFTARTPDYVKADVTMTLGARGVPVDSMLILGTVKHTWRWSDGTTLERMDSGPTYYDPHRDPALRRLLSLKKLAMEDDWLSAPSLDAGRDTVMRTREARITPSFAVRMHRESPAYTAELNYLLTKPELKFELPLQAGAREWIGATSVRLAAKQLPRVATEPWRLSQVASEPVFVRLALSLSMLIPMQTERAPITLFVVNRQANEAGYVSGWGGSRIAINSVMISWKNLEAGGSWYGGTRPEAESFMAGATLVGICFRDYRQFNQTIRVDRFAVTQR
jgi:hypothetical protein